MKRIHCILFFVLISFPVMNAQEVTMDLLKSGSWNWKQLDLGYAFTNDSIYRVYNSANYGTFSRAYYLSSEPQQNFREKLIGKVQKGNYIVVKDTETGSVYSWKIMSASNNEIRMFWQDDCTWQEAILTKNNSEKYDTLLLSSSYKELAYKHNKQYQQTFFDRFPSTWYDFERTFNGAFFRKEIDTIYKQDFSHDYEKYLHAFSNLPDIETKEYYRKLIDITIGMPLRSTPATDKWQDIVATKITTNKKLVTQLLKEKSEVQRTRFWQFVKKDNARLKNDHVKSKKQSYIKEIWRLGLSFDKECIYLTDSLCYIIKNCVPTRTPEITSIAPYQMKEDGNKPNGTILFTHIQVGKHTKLQMHILGEDGKYPTFYQKDPSLVTDTLLMAVAYRNMLYKTMDQQEMQRLFFDAFPSTWSDFYAIMISDEYGNNGFYRQASDYIAAFEKLTVIPVRELLTKMVSISIGAIAQDSTSEQWRTVVRNISNRNKEELHSVLLEFEPWQRLQFLQFVENKADVTNS